MSKDIEINIENLSKRWKEPENIKILKRLSKEKIDLSNIETSMTAAHSCFDVNDLRAIDFSSFDMSNNFLLFDVDLSYSNFSRKIIQGSFQNSKLKKCSFDESEILFCYFAMADLSCTSFKKCTIKSADFEDSNLNNVNFEESIVLDASFIGVDLTLTNFDGAKFHRVKLGNTKISKNNEFWKNALKGEGIINPEGIIWI